MSYRATMIKLNAEVMPMERLIDVIDYVRTTDGNLVLPQDVTQDTKINGIKVKHEFYKKLQVSTPHHRWGRYGAEYYYINVGEWDKALPIIEGLIESETRILTSQVNRLSNFKYKIENKWYVQIGRFIDRMFKING